MSTTPNAVTTVSGWSISDKQINFAWGTSEGAEKPVKYDVYRDGTKVGTVPAIADDQVWREPGCYQDLALMANTNYTYSVKAISADGSESGLSPTITIRTKVAGSVGTGIIPSDRLWTWSRAGVPGGIPNRTRLIDVTLPPYNADKTGQTSSSTAINDAIAAAQYGDVVYLPEGRYAASIYTYIKNGITIRGAGMDKTIMGVVTFRGTDVYNLTQYNVTAGFTKGTSILTVNDVSEITIGNMVHISSNNDLSLPVFSPGGDQHFRSQKSIVTAKQGNNITIDPPLFCNYDSSSTSIQTVRPMQDTGLEDLTIDGGGTAGLGISMTSCYKCWIKGVRVKGITNYNIHMGDCIYSEIRHCFIDQLNKANTPNGAGLLIGSSTANLIEDNVVYKSFPLIEQNSGCCGNVYGYNYMTGSQTNTNHGAHNHYNLWEGNIVDFFISDGYFGSESEACFYRNKTVGFGFAFKRWSRNFTVIGNQNEGAYSLGQVSDY